MQDFERRASFLGLPVELRLKIYDYAIHADPNCTILRDIQHSSDPRNGTQATLISNLKANLALDIPWVNLKLVCKAIAAELQSFMTDQAFLNDDQNRTYVLDFNIYKDAAMKATREAVWRSLPCAPNQAQVLIVNVAGREGASLWTEGGAAAMARALYQIMNHTCHKGPRMVGNRLLSDHMRLREVVLKIDRGCESEDERGPRFNYDVFARGLEQISKSGYMFEHIEKITLRSNEDGEMEMRIERTPPAMTGPWQNWGFWWGFDQFSKNKRA